MAAIPMSRVNIFDTVLGTIRLCPKMNYMFYMRGFPASVFSVLKDYVCFGGCRRTDKCESIWMIREVPRLRKWPMIASPGPCQGFAYQGATVASP